MFLTRRLEGIGMLSPIQQPGQGRDEAPGPDGPKQGEEERLSLTHAYMRAYMCALR